MTTIFTTTCSSTKFPSLTIKSLSSPNDETNVTKFWVDLESMEEKHASSISPFVVELIHQGVALNTTGSVHTEEAILSWAVKEMKMDMEKTNKSCAILQVEAFNSEKKTSGILIGRNNDDSVHVHWKGAAEMILAMCSSYYDGYGVAKHIDDGERTKFEQIIRGMAASNLRCIGFAHRQVPEEEYDDLKEKKKLNDNSLTLLGLVGIKNQCMPQEKKGCEGGLESRDEA